MLTGHDIVCFANDWDSDPLSKKHVMLRLARHNRVLWVDSLGCRNPTVSSRDLRRVAQKAQDFTRGCRRVAETLWVTSPLVVPFHGNALARRLNRRWLGATIRRTCRSLGMRDPVTWAFLPSSAEVAGSLGERLVVYHCVDEYSEFTGADREAIRAMDRRLAERADVVIVSAGSLLESKRRYNPETFLVTHGVEVEHFRRALDPDTIVPAEIDGPRGRGGGPVVGFFGLLADWVDLELVARVARERPRWTVVLIGKVDTDLGALRGLDNVRVLGPRPYTELPAYCKGFDAAILPFRVNELTVAANPLKLREYLAAGLPVVATAIPEAERLASRASTVSPHVRLGRDPEEFVRQLDAVLAGGATGPRWEVSASVEGESWDRKVDEMGRIVARFLGAGAPAGGARAGPGARSGARPGSRPGERRREGAAG